MRACASYQFSGIDGVQSVILTFTVMHLIVYDFQKNKGIQTH